MADERTPLVQVVRVAPPRQRYPHSTIRRFCTIALGSTLITVVILFLLPISWLPGPNGHEHDSGPPRSRLPHSDWPHGHGLKFDELQKILLETPDANRIRDSSKYYTAGPHLAGKNLSQAVWTKDLWQEQGIQSEIVAYDVYINYPKDHRLGLLEKIDGAVDASGKPKFGTIYEANLEEDVLEDDPTTGLEDRVPTFHGYSASGNVTAQYVYVNFGTYHDYEDLVNANVTLAGRIALVKYGRVFRGLKVKRAQELGMVGVVMYDDPQVDGDITEKNGYRPYPEGPARNPSAVQRGSTQFLSIAPGDPTTPGYPSLPGAPRQDTKGAIPDIPSLPISYREALPILKALNGYGKNSSDFNKYWQGGGLAHKGVEYNIGPSEAYLNLVNEQEYVTTPLWNVIGIINGTIPDEVVIIGNHRDAWIAGGAGDPNSGSAALNEVIRSFAVALKKGWKPLRTIVFASWDGEEYGLIGSTEWVEEYLPWLSGSAVAYLNVDIGAVSQNFDASASPLLNKALFDVTSHVQSPNQTIKGQTVRDLWDGRISPMGSGSDYTAFQDFAGIPSLDIGFKGGAVSAVYQYHSNYDSFHWMETYGDPGFHYHATIAKVFALLTAKLAETPVLAISTTDYAEQLVVYLQGVIDHAKKSPITDMKSYAFQGIQDAIGDLIKVSQAFDKKAKKLEEKVEKGVSWWNWRHKARLFKAVRDVNTKYKHFERQFLYAKGLDSRTWFKHIVFAPGLWTGYSGETFPGLVEAVDAGNKTAIEVSAGPVHRPPNPANMSIEME
jgi:N-acetylated-alpha-linked acidic dipeptidase